MSASLAISVRARLLNLARAQNADFNQILVRFALERMLYRLSQSKHADRFVLKGALLFTLWYDLPHRSTRDADLLGSGPSDVDSLVRTFRDVAVIDGQDGLNFDPESVVASEIRKAAIYAGTRVEMSGELAGAQCKTQIDIGFGDAITPGPVDANFPVLITTLPVPRLRTYTVETVIAEKFHAIVMLGMTNSRMKDYLDLLVVMEREAIEPTRLFRAIDATFRRRETPLPVEWPLGLSDAFGSDASRQTLWAAFLRKQKIASASLPEVVVRLREAFVPVLRI